MAQMRALTTTSRLITDWLKEQNANRKRDIYNLEDLVGDVFNEDATAYLSHFPNESVDVILTDEPYGVSQTRNTFKGEGGKYGSHTKWEWDDAVIPKEYEPLIIDKNPRAPLHIITDWMFESSRVLKEGGWLINFGMPEWITTMQDVMTHAGLSVKSTWAWFKTNPPPHIRKVNSRNGIEIIIAACKGKGKINFLEQQEMINWIAETKCPSCGVKHPFFYANNYDKPQWAHEINWGVSPSVSGVKEFRHPTQKPVWLISKLLTIYSNKGGLVVDPYAGSGVIVETAHDMNRLYSANDLSKKWSSYISEKMKNKPYNVLGV